MFLSTQRGTSLRSASSRIVHAPGSVLPNKPGRATLRTSTNLCPEICRRAPDRAALLPELCGRSRVVRRTEAGSRAYDFNDDAARAAPTRVGGCGTFQEDA